MRSKSINVHALMDESEDPLELLEAYFNTTVLNLTDTGAGAVISNTPVSAIALPTVISPFHHPSSSAASSSSSSSLSSVAQTEEQREREHEEQGRNILSPQTQMELESIKLDLTPEVTGPGRV